MDPARTVVGVGQDAAWVLFRVLVLEEVGLEERVDGRVGGGVGVVVVVPCRTCQSKESQLPTFRKDFTNYPQHLQIYRKRQKNV